MRIAVIGGTGLIGSRVRVPATHVQPIAADDVLTAKDGAVIAGTAYREWLARHTPCGPRHPIEAGGHQFSRCADYARGAACEGVRASSTLALASHHQGAA